MTHCLLFALQRFYLDTASHDVSAVVVGGQTEVLTWRPAFAQFGFVLVRAVIRLSLRDRVRIGCNHANQ